ncbi:hypothetical protein E4U21_005827 [Claviceps maximensis]|nr:hypothetical protein E4U21_005827 [Claviceps maximensis]
MDSHPNAGCLSEIAQQTLAHMESMRPLPGSSPIIDAEPKMEESFPYEPSMYAHDIVLPDADANANVNGGLVHPGANAHASSLNDWMDQRRLRFPRHQRTTNSAVSSTTLSASPVQSNDLTIKREPEAEELALFGHAGIFSQEQIITPLSSRQSVNSHNGAHGPMFHGTIRIESKHRAIDTAMAIHEAGSSLNHIVLWTGASFSARSLTAAYSVVNHITGKGWAVKFRRATEHHTDMYLSLRCIETALDKAFEQVQHWPHTQVAATTIRIFNGHKLAVKAIKALPQCSLKEMVYDARRILDVLDNISILSRRLADLGTTLELLWIPNYRIPGRMIAKSVALYAVSVPNGPREDSWIIPDQAPVNNPPDETTSKQEMFEGSNDGTETKVETECKTGMETQTGVKDEHDDKDMYMYDGDYFLVEAETRTEMCADDDLVVKKEEKEDDDEGMQTSMFWEFPRWC